MNRVTYTYTKKTCPKCNGKGTLDQYHHIAGGQCFRCNGTGEVNDRLTQRIKTVEEMESELAEKGIIFGRYDDDIEYGDDWEEMLFSPPTPERIAYNEMREKMIIMAYANA